MSTVRCLWSVYHRSVIPVATQMSLAPLRLLLSIATPRQGYPVKDHLSIERCLGTPASPLGSYLPPGMFLLKVARLQSEICTKVFFSSYEFSYEKCSEIFHEIFEPLFCGSEKIPAKFPPNFPLNFPNFPAKNQKKNHRRASAGAQGECSSCWEGLISHSETRLIRLTF